MFETEAKSKMLIVKPYRVTRGRVNAQVLIDISNVINLASDADEAVRGIRAIVGNVNFGLKGPAA